MKIQVQPDFKKYLLLEDIENYHPKYDPNIYIGCSFSTKEEITNGKIDNFTNIKSFLVPIEDKDFVLTHLESEDFHSPPQPFSYFDDEGNYITGEIFEEEGIKFEIIVNEREFEGLDISYYEPTDRLITYLRLQRDENNWIDPYNEEVIIRCKGNTRGWEPHSTYISIHKSKLIDYLAARKCGLIILRYSERTFETPIEYSGLPDTFEEDEKTPNGTKYWSITKNDLNGNFVYRCHLTELYWIDPAPYPRRNDFKSSKVSREGVSFVLDDGERSIYDDSTENYLKLISFDLRALNDFLSMHNNKIEFSSLTNLSLKYADASSLSGCINPVGQFQALFGLIGQLDVEKQIKLAAFSEPEKSKMAYEYFLNNIEGKWTNTFPFSWTLSKCLTEVNSQWDNKFGEKLLLNPNEDEIPVQLLIGPISNNVGELIDMMLEFQKLIIPESNINNIKKNLDYSNSLSNQDDYNRMRSIAFTRLFFKENSDDGNIGESYILNVINELRNCKAHPKNVKEILKKYNIPENSIRNAYFFVLSEFCNFLLVFKDFTEKSLGLTIISNEDHDPWEKLEIARKYYSNPNNNTMKQIYNE
ncbi:MAG: hypothetical protein ACC609_09110 [Methanobacterium formicicum]